MRKVDTFGLVLVAVTRIDEDQIHEVQYKLLNLFIYSMASSSRPISSHYFHVLFHEDRVLMVKTMVLHGMWNMWILATDWPALTQMAWIQTLIGNTCRDETKQIISHLMILFQILFKIVWMKSVTCYIKWHVNLESLSNTHIVTLHCMPIMTNL